MYLKEYAGATRYVGKIDIGGQPFADIIKGIELFATKVKPALMTQPEETNWKG
jgi:hypothetical protein